MKTQFTPGPWAFSPNFSKPVVGKPLNDGGPMLPICNTVGGLDNEQCRANARAIAALPELVAALVRLHAEVKAARTAGYYSNETLRDADMAAESALAKVKG